MPVLPPEAPVPLPRRTTKYWIMVECSEVDLDAEEEVLNRARLYRDRRDFVIQSGDTGRRQDYPASPAYSRGGTAPELDRT